MGRFDVENDGDRFDFGVDVYTPLNKAIQATTRLVRRRGALRTDDPVVQELVPKMYAKSPVDFFEMVGMYSYDSRADELNPALVPPVRYSYDRMTRVATLVPVRTTL